MTAVHDPQFFVCGDTWEMTGPLQDANGVPFNLAGASISWKLDSIDGATNFLSLAVGSGIQVLDLTSATVLVTVSATQSESLTPGTYRDSLRVTLADGAKFTEWVGAITATVDPK